MKPETRIGVLDPVAKQLVVSEPSTSPWLPVSQCPDILRRWVGCVKPLPNVLLVGIYETSAMVPFTLGTTVYLPSSIEEKRQKRLNISCAVFNG